MLASFVLGGRGGERDYANSKDQKHLVEELIPMFCICATIKQPLQRLPQQRQPQQIQIKQRRPQQRHQQ